MTSISKHFKDRFGPWALIAGASEGLGAAYAKEIAKYGINIALIARRKDALEELSKELISKFNVQTKIIVLDLTTPDLLERIIANTKDLEIGLLVYNAALSPIGSFYNFDLEKHLKVIDVNCKGPMILTHHFGKKMIERKKGGIILMSSLAGLQGDPVHAHYSATRGYTANLAEALWFELRFEGVNVLTCKAGPTNTPNYIISKPKRAGLVNPKPMDPAKVAKGALKDLWRNKPFHIPGFSNKFSAFLLQKILTRKLAIKMMGNVALKMYGLDKNHVNK
ncbi:MAG: SDR family NAD(P)-dependent oxidoreductase [Asgard group archaeon]|nr:SDR family NAD(P)-dependent oxidoreductase [Asgard group archaeon]